MNYDNYINPVADSASPQEEATKRKATKRTTMKRYFTIIVLIVLSFPSFAQQKEEHGIVTMTLDSCEAMALRNQAKVRQARLQVDAAKATKDAAYTKFFPTLGAQAGCFYSLSPMIDLHSSESGATIDVEASYRGVGINEDALRQLIEEEFGNYIEGLELDVNLQALTSGAFANLMAMQPVFAGGRIINGNKLAQLGIDVAEIQQMMTEDEVRMTVAENYYRVSSLYEKAATLEMAIRLLDTLERDAMSGTAAGVISKNDLLKVRLKKNEYKSLMTQLENGYEMSLRALMQYIGMEYCDTATFSFSMPEMTLISSDSNSFNPSRRKEYQLLQKAVDAEELKKRMLVGEALPQLSVGATYGANNMFSEGFKHNGLVFATLSVPLTQAWETYHKHQKQDIELQMAQIRLEDVSQQMALQQRQAYNEATEAATLVELKRQAVSDAEENLAEVRNYYQAGMLGTSDFLEAQTLLQQAQNDLYDQEINLRLKVARFKQLTQ